MVSYLAATRRRTMDSLTRAPIIATIAFSFMTHTPPSEARRWPLGAASAGADRLRADEQVRQRGVVQERVFRAVA